MLLRNPHPFPLDIEANTPPICAIARNKRRATAEERFENRSALWAQHRDELRESVRILAVWMPELVRAGANHLVYIPATGGHAAAENQNRF